MVGGRDAAIVFKEQGEEDAASSRVRSHRGELAPARRPGRSRTESSQLLPSPGRNRERRSRMAHQGSSM